MSRHTHQVDVDNDGAVVGVVNLVPEISFAPPTAESQNHVNFDLCDLFWSFYPQNILGPPNMVAAVSDFQVQGCH